MVVAALVFVVVVVSRVAADCAHGSLQHALLRNAARTWSGPTVNKCCCMHHPSLAVAVAVMSQRHMRDHAAQDPAWQNRSQYTGHAQASKQGRQAGRHIYKHVGSAATAAGRQTCEQGGVSGPPVAVRRMPPATCLHLPLLTPAPGAASRPPPAHRTDPVGGFRAQCGRTNGAVLCACTLTGLCLFRACTNAVAHAERC